MAPTETSFFIKTLMQEQNLKPKNNQPNNEQTLLIVYNLTALFLKRYAKTADNDRAERKHATEAYEDNQRTRLPGANPQHLWKIRNDNAQTATYKTPQETIVTERKKSTKFLFFKIHAHKTETIR
jgi:hypothetical protein